MNCQVGNNPAVSGNDEFEISRTPGTIITDNIVLSSASTSIFRLSGSGEYTLSGVISGGVPHHAVSMLIQVEEGTLILAGASPNTFTGMIEMSSGQLVLNKKTGTDPSTGIISVPGGLSMAERNENTVWCMADNQFNPGVPGTAECQLIFRRMTNWQRFNLFGTKQTIGGIEGDANYAIIQHGENQGIGHPLPSLIANEWASRNTPSVLTLNGNFNYNYHNSPHLRARNSTQDFTVNKTGTGTQTLESINTGNSASGRLILNVSAGTLICQNPNSNVTQVTFNSLPGGTIEFRGTGTAAYCFGAGCVFTGGGAFKSTGASATIGLQPYNIPTIPGNAVSITGPLKIESGTLKNDYNNVNWSDSRADVNISAGAAFDLWGNTIPTIIDELSGSGMVRNDFGDWTNPLFASELRIGVKNGSSSFDGIIINTTRNNNVPLAAFNGGSINLVKTGTGTQTFTGANTYSGTTVISGGRLGGSGSIASSPVTVEPGSGIFGGMGTGDNKVFTTGNLTFTGTSANPSHVAVYVNNTATPVENALSLIQVGGTPGSRTGTGTLTANAGATVDIDFMDPVTVAEGTYTIISSANASVPEGTFRTGINNSGCCMKILKTQSGIQVTVTKIILTPNTLSACPSVAGISKTIPISITGNAITAHTPGVWSVNNSVNNAAGEATTGTAAISDGTVTGHSNSATITAKEPGSVNVVFTIPVSPDERCSGTTLCRVDIASKPAISGTASACSSAAPVSLTGTVSSGASNPDWNIYADNAAATGSKSTSAASIDNGNSATTGIVTPKAGGTAVIRLSDSNQCFSEPFVFTVNPTAALELLSGGTPDSPNTTCPTGTTAGNAKPVILAKYASGKPASDAGISWTFTSAAPIGWHEPASVTTDVATRADGVTGTYEIQCNTFNDNAYAVGYTLKYTDANTCSSTLDLTVTRQPLLVNSAHNTDPITICPGGTAVFSHLNTDPNWKWSTGNPDIAKSGQEGIAMDYPLSSTITGYSLGSTVIFLTDMHGCNSEKLPINVIDKPTVTAASSVICATTGGVAGRVEFGTQSENTGHVNPWSINPPNNAATLSAPSADNKTISLEVADINLTAPATVAVQYNNNTAEAKCAVSKEITIKPSPVIEVSTSAICAAVNGDAAALTLRSNSEPEAPNPWSLSSGSSEADLSNLSGDKKSITFTVHDKNQTTVKSPVVKYTALNGCAGIKTITINPSPVIDTGDPFVVCATVNGQAGTLNIGATGAAEAAANPWSFNSGSGEADLLNPSENKKTITFTVHDKNQASVKSSEVQYTDVNGCLATKAITINPSPRLEGAPGINLSELCQGSTSPQAISVSGAGGTGTAAWGITANSINTQVTGNDPLTAASITAGTTTQAVTHTITYTSGYGCVSNALSATVNPGATLSLPANGTNKLCHVGTTVQLSASGNTSYSWSSDNEAVATVDTHGLVKSVATGTAIISASIAGSTLCAGRQAVTVDDPVVGTATDFDAAKLCAGKDYPDVLTLTNGGDMGTWRVYDAADAASVTATGTSALWGTDRASAVKKGSIHTDNVSGTVNRYVAFTQNNCESPRLLITIAAPPVMEAVTNRTLCAGAASGEIALTSTATGDQAANVFKWSGGADVGLADKSDPAASPIPSFTAVNNTTSAATRTVAVLPVNSHSKCVGTGTTFNVSVNPAPVVTAASGIHVCSGAETNFGLQPNIPDMLYTWTVSRNEAGATDETTKKNDIKQTLTNRGTADVTVTYTITPQTAEGCIGAPVTSDIVVKSTEGVSAAGTTGGGSFCLIPVANGTNGNPRSKPGGTYTTDITPKISPDDPEVKWVYTSAHSPNISGTTSSGTTPQTLAAIKDNLVSTVSDSETVKYSLTPYSGGCAGTTIEVEIVLKPAPEFTGDENSVPDITICGGAAHPDIEILQVASSGLTKPTGFTWTAAGAGDDTGLADYTDATRPREKLGPFTAVNTAGNKQRSITITPHNTDTGCSGLAQAVEILLKPGPEISPANPEICSTNMTPLLLTTTNPGNATNDPTNPWTILSGAEYGSIAYHPGDGTKGDFTPVNNAAGQPAGAKTVKVQYTDANSCTAVTDVSVIDPPGLTFTSDTHPTLCAGDTDNTAAATSIGISAQPDIKYTWSAAKGTERVAGDVWVNGAKLPAASTVPKEAPLLEKVKAPAGSDVDIIFSVTPVSGSCEGAAKTITVKVIGSGFATGATPASNIICNGLPSGITVGGADDGNLYTWTVDDHNGSVAGAEAQPSPGVSGGTPINTVLSLPSDRKIKKAGLVTYNIVATRDGCQGSPTEVSVEVEPIPVISGPASGNICNNTPTGIVLSTDVDPAEAGKVKYTWTVNTNNVGAQSNTTPQSAFTDQTLKIDAGTQIPADQNVNKGSPEGMDASVTYTFTAAYGTCAGPAMDIVRTVTSPIIMNTVSGGGKACLGDRVTLTSNAKAGANGGALTYRWWKNNDTTPIEGAAGQSYTVPAGAESNDSYHVSVSNTCETDAAAQPVSVQMTKEAYFEGAAATAAYPAEGATIGKDWVEFTYTPARAEDAAHTIYAWDFGDATFIAGRQNTSHLYTSGTTGSVTPTLTVKKAGQEVCTKTWTLPPITLQGTRFDPTTGDPNNTRLQVFPLPARDQITLIGESEMTRITISDLNGKQVLSTSAAGNQVVLPVTGLSSGLYILTVETDRGVKRVKIVKE